MAWELHGKSYDGVINNSNSPTLWFHTVAEHPSRLAIECSIIATKSWSSISFLQHLVCDESGLRFDKIA